MLPDKQQHEKGPAAGKVVTDNSLTLDLEDDDHIARQSPAKTTFNISKTIIGAGIFGSPYALNNSGLVVGLVLILSLGFLFYWTLMTQTRAAVIADADNVQDLAKRCFGKKGEAVLNLVLFLNVLGAMLAYTLILADSMTDVFRVVMGEPQTPFMTFFLSRRGLLIIMSLFVLLPISSARSLAGLAKYSILALGGLLFIIISTLATAPTLTGGPSQGPLAGKDWKGVEGISIVNPVGIPGAISVFSFAYVCHQNILLNFHQMKNRNIKTFKKVVGTSLITTVVMTLLIGSLYFTFIENSQPNVLNNFPTQDTLYVICRLLFGVDMLFTYPLELYVLRDTIEQALFKAKPFSKIRFHIINVLIVLTTLGVGLLTCDLGIVMELTGGVASSCLAFLFPSLLYLRANQLNGQILSRSEKVCHVACIIFGLCIMILTIVITAVEASEASTKECNW